MPSRYERPDDAPTDWPRDLLAEHEHDVIRPAVRVELTGLGEMVGAVGYLGPADFALDARGTVHRVGYHQVAAIVFLR